MKLLSMLILATGMAAAQGVATNLYYVTSDPSGFTPCSTPIEYNSTDAILWIPAAPVNHMCTWTAVPIAALVGVISSNEVIASSTTPVFTTGTRSSETLVTASITTFTLPAGADGQEKTLTFCQNATGGYTVGHPANVRGFGTVGVTASLCSSQHFTYHVSQTAWLADSSMVINE